MQSFDDLPGSIGRRVREQRGFLGWTLDELAAHSGVSRRTIVNVEQGSVNASIGILLRLSDALGIGIPSLVAPDRVGALTHVLAGDGTALWEGEGGGRGILLAGTAPPDVVELWEWSLGPGDRHSSEAHTAGTREIAHLREGELVIEASGNSIALATGDTLTFDGDADHAYINPGTTTTRFTLVVFEPNVHTPESRRA